MQPLTRLVSQAAIAAALAVTFAAVDLSVTTGGAGGAVASARPLDRATGAAAPQPSLGPVREVSLPGGFSTRSPEAVAQVVETIVLEILPGPLTVSPANLRVTLERVGLRGGRAFYRGRLPIIRVVDARGSFAGWTASVWLTPPSPLNVEGSTLRVRPGRAVVVYGETAGVHRAPSTRASFGAPVALFRAEAGHGGGTFEDDAIVELTVPLLGWLDVGAVTLDVAVSVS